MIIRVDDDDNIFELIGIGGIPEDDPHFFILNRDDVPVEILEHIFDYKYINGEFIHKDSVDSKYLSNVRDEKIRKMSVTCNQIIENGIDFNNEHYSLTNEDQMNLTNLSLMSQTLPFVPYHADGKLCRSYSSEEIQALSNAAILWITYHTTYYNFLKAYIKSITDINELLTIHYGFELPQEYLTRIEEIMGTIDLTKYVVNVPDTTNYDTLMGKVDLSKMHWDDDIEPDPDDIEGGEDFEETSENDTVSNIEDESDDTDDSP